MDIGAAKFLGLLGSLFMFVWAGGLLFIIGFGFLSSKKRISERNKRRAIRSLFAVVATYILCFALAGCLATSTGNSRLNSILDMQHGSIVIEMDGRTTIITNRGPIQAFLGNVRKADSHWTMRGRGGQEVIVTLPDSGYSYVLHRPAGGHKYWMSWGKYPGAPASPFSVAPLRWFESPDLSQWLAHEVNQAEQPVP